MYRTTRGSEQRRLQCLQDIQKLQEEIKLLQISNEKLNGVGLDDMSFTELASLGSMLDEGFRIVDEQLDNVVGAHEEITTKQNREEDLAYQSLLAGRRVALRNKAREFRLSPPETQPWRSDDPERLVKTIDSLEMEKERLRLFNQRMLGKELDGMSYSELFVFSFEISGAIMKVVSMKKIKRDEEMGKTKRPRPSVNVRFIRSFLEIVIDRFVNHQAEAPIVSLHRAIALVQLEGVNELQMSVLLNCVNVLLADIYYILTMMLELHTTEPINFKKPLTAKTWSYFGCITRI
ncbi:unnamed protein product [Brassica napus]|uniref:(rape) hypothetical protein n=1 Tax=Brassica napus TaxID=3708 RepID=A0A816K652_BRANA|nr:unnamed protein product [Brassica napus]